MGPLIERVEAGHVRGFEFEPEDVRVLADPLGADGLRDDDETVLEAPADQDLRGRAAILRGDLSDRGMLQALSAREGAVRLQLDPMGPAVLEKFFLEQEGMELDLIDRGWHRTRRQQFFQVRDHVVAESDRPHLTLVSKFEQSLPGLLTESGDRPMNEIQVHVLQAEFAAALLERPKGRL